MDESLFDLACKNDGPGLRRMISLGADPNAISSDGNTALYTACIANHAEAVKALLDLGAAPNKRFTYHCPIDGRIEADRTAIMYTTSLEVLGLLLTKNAEVNAEDANGTTALILAAARGHVEVVEGLIAAGANPLQRDKAGWSALDFVEEKLEFWRSMASTAAVDGRILRFEKTKDILLVAEKNTAT